MTEPREVVVTDEEIHEFLMARNRAHTKPGNYSNCYREALAAFLAARVPDALDTKLHCPGSVAQFRDRVLKGV